MIVRLGPDEQARQRHVPATDRARARIVLVRWWLPGVAATTLGRWILMRRGHERDRSLLAHELVHVRQWRQLGAARFLVEYLGAYARGRLGGLAHHAAYAAIPFEVEARALAGR